MEPVSRMDLSLEDKSNDGLAKSDVWKNKREPQGAQQQHPTQHPDGASSTTSCHATSAVASSPGRQASLRLHRDKERIRHQNLNKLIEQLWNKVPGHNIKCTKVWQLRKSIRYISFLEVLVEKLSLDLGVPLTGNYKRLSIKSSDANEQALVIKNADIDANKENACSKRQRKSLKSSAMNKERNTSNFDGNPSCRRAILTSMTTNDGDASDSKVKAFGKVAYSRGNVPPLSRNIRRTSRKYGRTGGKPTAATGESATTCPTTSDLCNMDPPALIDSKSSIDPAPVYFAYEDGLGPVEREVIL